MRRVSLLTALLLLALAMGSLVAHAQSAVSWQRYDVDLRVQTDGSLGVTETQAITFNGTIQHGFRVIPLDRATGITDVSVSEQVNGSLTPYMRGTNRPGTFSTQRVSEGQQIDWWFTPATNTTRTFVLQYVAHDAVRQYGDGDQAFWKAIYADRDGPIAEASIVVHVPTDTMQSMAYRFGDSSGELGAGTQVDSRTVRFALGSLPARTGAEARVQFAHGAITANPPPWQADADRQDWLQQSVAPIAAFISLLLTLAIAAGGGAVLFWLWYSSGREPSIGAVPAELDQPPSDLPAPLAGTLVDGSADLQDVVATLVDLGERGVVTLRDQPLPDTRTDVQVILHGSVDAPELRPYERVLLSALFGFGANGGDILLSVARPSFVAAIPILEERLHGAMATEGLFVADPAQVRKRYTVIGAGLAVAGVVLAVLALAALGGVAPIVLLPGAAVTVIGVVLMVLARAMPRRTPRGALEAARWRAFRNYLGNERRHGSQDHRYLSYAVAFGLDRSFLRQLEQTGTPRPGWYGGNGPVVIVPGGGGWYGPWPGGGRGDGGLGSHPGTAGGASVGPPGSPSPEGWSDALAGLLNVASEALSHGGGSGGWSGGSWGGGGGGGGGSGGFN